MSWCATLVGDESELARWSSYFSNPETGAVQLIERDGAGRDYVLSSNTLGHASNQEAALHLSAALVAKMSGIAKLKGSKQRVRLGHLFRVNEKGGREYFANFNEGIDLNTFLDATLNETNLDLSSDAVEWFMAAALDQNVSDALQHFSRSDGWFDIYKTLEVVFRDLGGQDKALTYMEDRNWESTSQIKLLKQTANYYRHAQERPPVRAMAQKDASSLLFRIMRLWLDDKVIKKVQ